MSEKLPGLTIATGIGAVRRGLSKLAAAFLSIERVGFFEADLTAEPVCLAGLQQSINFHIGNTEDVLAQHEAELRVDFGLRHERIAHRLRQGHIPILGFNDRQLVAMAWLAFNQQRVSEVGRTMVLRPGEALSYDEATAPHWRGLGISAHLNQFADEYARQQGARRRISWRLLGNKAALRVADKLGDEMFAVVTAVRVASLPQVWLVGAIAPELSDLLQQV